MNLTLPDWMIESKYYLGESELKISNCYELEHEGLISQDAIKFIKSIGGEILYVKYYRRNGRITMAFKVNDGKEVK